MTGTVCLSAGAQQPAAHPLSAAARRRCLADGHARLAGGGPRALLPVAKGDLRHGMEYGGSGAW